MKKFLSTCLIFIFISTSTYAFDFNKIYNVKIFSSAKLEVNDTNLIDQENAETLVGSIKDLDAVLKEQSKEIIKQNRNRKTQKYKGAEDIYSDYAESVVYIGNRKKGKWIGSGSGFVVSYNGLKIITNWHVIDGADTIGVWLKPNKIVDDKYLIENQDYYQAELINFNKKRDLAILKVQNLPLKTF